MSQKSEEDLILRIKSLRSFEECMNFAANARKYQKRDLEMACIERADELRPKRKNHSIQNNISKKMKKTNRVAEAAFNILSQDYLDQSEVTTYKKLADRCKEEPGRWFGQVTDLIDAACALANVESFALVRVRSSNGDINPKAWSKQHSNLREQIIENAEKATWSKDDFEKVSSHLADFSRRQLGNKKAWAFVKENINLEKWARHPRS
jgi:hypothetical protein